MNTTRRSTSSSASAKPMAKSLLLRLQSKRMALRKRRGRWEVLTPDGLGQGVLPRRLAGLADLLAAEGALQAGHDGLFRPSGSFATAVRDSGESPLQKLLMRKARSGEGQFTSDMVRAGEALRRDFERAHLVQRVTTNYASPEGGTSRHWQASDNAVLRLADGVFAARQRVHQALDAVGPELSGLLLQVCCMTSGFEEAERALALPRRSARAVLSLGLIRLARHYGFRERLRHAGPAQIGHWAAAGSRPQIPPEKIMPQGPGPHQT